MRQFPVFRVFVSSTFADMRLERAALQANCFGRLQRYCAERGARFQAIDLRWGISEEAGRDQRTMVICLGELKRCQDLTPRPNFVVLLGDRYGWVPLPAAIEAAEYGEIETRLESSDKRKLRRWYRLDENALPAEYVLLPRRGRFGEASLWQQEEDQLRQILQSAAQGLWPEADARKTKYFASATHQEIERGALSAQAGVGHAHAYLRTLEWDAAIDADDDLRLRLEERDPARRQALTAMRRQIRNHLPEHQVHDYRLQAPLADSDPGLLALSDAVEANLRKVIDAELASMSAIPPLQVSREAHHEFARQRASQFQGRSQQLDAIREYLSLEGGDDRGAPLFVHGPSGSGKTALMANMALELENDPEALLIYRFVDATPNSSALRPLLESLCNELLSELPGKAIDGTGIDALIRQFESLLAKVAAERPVVVLIDAIDQLDPEGSPERLAWLPNELPEKVRIVVSALERAGDKAGKTYRTARSESQRFSTAAFLAVPQLEQEAVAAALDSWLARRKRQLQPEQRQGLLARASANGLPLYLRLAMEEAAAWRSFDTPRSTFEALPDTIEALLDHRFKVLSESNQHGAALVRSTMGMLAASRAGLSEDEMLGLLSQHKPYLRSFERQARHPVMHGDDGHAVVPIILWSRLQLDLQGYLTEVESEGAILHMFYHRQVREAAERLYLKAQVHGQLSRYFLSAPLRFADVLNARKLTELPYQLRQAKKFQEIAGECSTPEFIGAMVEAQGLNEALTELQQNFDVLAAGHRPVLAKRVSLGLLRYVLERARSDQPIDIEDIHAMLVYRDKPEFYSDFLRSATRMDLLKMHGGRLPKETIDELFRSFSIRLGNVLRRKYGDLSGAVKAWEPIKHAFDQLKGLSEKALREASTFQYDQGYVAYLQGRLDSALDLLRRSEETAKYGGVESSEHYSRMVRFAIAFRAGRMPLEECLGNQLAAESFFSQTADKDETAKRGKMNAIAHRLEMYCDVDDVDQARKTLAALERDAWVIANSWDQGLLRRRAKVESIEKNHDSAIDLYERFLSLYEKYEPTSIESYATMWCEYAEILNHAGRVADAQSAWEQAVNLADEPGNHLGKERAQTALAEL